MKEMGQIRLVYFEIEEKKTILAHFFFLPLPFFPFAFFFGNGLTMRPEPESGYAFYPMTS